MLFPGKSELSFQFFSFFNMVFFREETLKKMLSFFGLLTGTCRIIVNTDGDYRLEEISPHN